MAGAVRALAMARKTAIASNDDNNHVDGNDSDNYDDHVVKGVKDGDNNDDADNDDEVKDDENGGGDGENDEDDDDDEQ